MKREIKFRRAHFKDEAKTQFSHFSEWGVCLHPGIPFTSPSSNNFAMYFEDLQYTGLKDENGEEIYEGDIVWHISRYKKKERKLKYKIGYNILHCCYGMFSQSGFYKELEGNPFPEIGPINKSRKYEVIGNIYENPIL